MRRACALGSLASISVFRRWPLQPLSLRKSCRWLSNVKVKEDSVQVPVGGSGHVQVDILSPLKPDPSAAQRLVVHLPSGLDVLDPSRTVCDNAAAIPSWLSSHLPSSTIVTINYRLSASSSRFGYPVPIHDVSAAFGHILNTFNANGPIPRVCLHGTHIGGALACMLALTQANNVDGLAVSQPLVDWVGPDDYTTKQEAATTTSKAKRAGPTEPESKAAESLIRLRTSLFRAPGAYFDPFASPTLFLRAPGRDTPRTHNIEDQTSAPDTDEWVPAEAYGPYDDDLVYNSHLPASQDLQGPVPEMPQPSTEVLLESPSSPTTNETISSSHSPPGPQRRRKVLRRWPSTGPPESATVPPTRIFLPIISPQSTGLDRILYRQGIELADLMRRACFWGRDKGFAEERVGLEMYKNHHPDRQRMEDYMEVERKNVGQIAEWIERTFDHN